MHCPGRPIFHHMWPSTFRFARLWQIIFRFMLAGAQAQLPAPKPPDFAPPAGRLCWQLANGGFCMHEPQMGKWKNLHNGNANTVCVCALRRVPHMACLCPADNFEMQPAIFGLLQPCGTPSITAYDCNSALPTFGSQIREFKCKRKHCLYLCIAQSALHGLPLPRRQF